uniref:Chlorophyll a-b binding protein, chloroplastic n=1 Tax=Tetradesmus obliquus TaxID=3088 RepID=A0A383W8P1_TETOB|eukprot:jgi/Sobl393_1/2873/SZX74007.1
MIATKQSVACRALGSRCLPARPFSSSQRRSVVRRFKEDPRPEFAKSNTEELRKDRVQTSNPTEPRLSQEQIEEVQRKGRPGDEMGFEPGSISKETAEMRADLGKQANFWDMQVFDGPAPETINGRASMLAVVLGLFLEARTGQGLLEQTKDHPISVFAVFVVIALASYIPLARGYTRKEPYANHNLGFNWTPKAENWNGRIAMMGFTGMLLTEWIAGCNTLQAWGLQSIPFPHL